MRYGLIDMDGVLIDSESMHERAVHQTIQQLGIDPKRVDLESFRGVPDAVNMRRLAELCDPIGDALAILEQRQANFRALVPQIRLYPGAVALLLRLNACGYHLALATSALPENQLRIVERFQLDRYFDAVVTAADITRGKPDPEPFVKALQKLGGDMRAAFALEDSLAGVQSAKAAGAFVVAVPHTFPAAQLLAAGADLVIPALGAFDRALRLFDPLEHS